MGWVGVIAVLGAVSGKRPRTVFNEQSTVLKVRAQRDSSSGSTSEADNDTKCSAVALNAYKVAITRALFECSWVTEQTNCVNPLQKRSAVHGASHIS